MRRGLLLLMVTVGLFAMHGLGHTGVHQMGSDGRTHAATMDSTHHMPSIAAPVMPSSPLDTAACCVAVLTSLGMIALVLSWLWSRLPVSVHADAGRWLADRGVRGPPRAWLGLRLADLAVSRN